MKTPPVGFVRTLKAYNRDLRIRWSYERAKWIVEHKAPDRRAVFVPVRMEMTCDGKILEHRLPEKSDRYIQYHDCYYPVCYLNRLNVGVIGYLASIDTAHFKNAKAYARSVDEGEAHAEAHEDRKKREDMAGHSNDVYGYLKNRGTQAFPGGTAR